MKPVKPAEALAFARRQKVVLPTEYYGLLQGRARAAAFSIAGLSALEQIEQIKASLVKALEQGWSFGKWKKAVAAGEVPLNLPAHRIETIFRTNIQGWYASGRCRAHQAAKDVLPYLMYSAINDSRTRPSHAAMHGFIARVDDPIWKTWMPPAGFNCRCTTIQLTEEEAKEHGFKPFPGQTPDQGWDYSVCDDGPEEGVARAIEGRKGRCGRGLDADPVEHLAAELAAREPWWCKHQELRSLIDDHLQRLNDWKDAQKLVRAVLGDDEWRKRAADPDVRNASITAGIDLPYGVILNAYTDRGLNIWREALLLGRVIVHDASLRGWTDERIIPAGLFLHLLNEAVSQLEPVSGAFYRLIDTRQRGFGQRFREQHKAGNTIEFVVPTSVMRSLEDLENGGYSGDMVIELEATSARDIQAFSVMNEPELLLPAGAQAIIVAREGKFLRLEEVEPKGVPANKKFGAHHVG